MRSAQVILQTVREALNPGSVVDVGCGTGAWLKVWSDYGVENILGIDGEWVRPDQLLIPRNRFRQMDLTAPSALDEKFDLVESLEVAEHLPAAAADAFVAFLCSLGNVVLFSAAIPCQGGTHHLNEQWPGYWAALFQLHGFVAIDAIRDRFWDNEDVDWWYAQNTLFFVQSEHLPAIRQTSELFAGASQGAPSRVHPQRWIAVNAGPIPLENLVAALPRSSIHFVQRAFRKLGHLFRA